MSAALKNPSDFIFLPDEVWGIFVFSASFVRRQKISGDNVPQFLLYFNLLCDKFTDRKKEFLQSFADRADAFPEEQSGGRFPAFFEGAKVENMRWDNEMTVESIVTLIREE